MILSSSQKHLWSLKICGPVLINLTVIVHLFKVLLIEAGVEEPLAAQVPAFANFMQGYSIDRKYETQLQRMACRSFKNSVCPLPRGKVMGGTSTINGMIYIRGNKEDYNDWTQLGNPGWSYDEVLQYFMKSEDNLNADVSPIYFLLFFFYRTTLVKFSKFSKSNFAHRKNYLTLKFNSLEKNQPITF